MVGGGGGVVQAAGVVLKVGRGAFKLCLVLEQPQSSHSELLWQVPVSSQC